MNNLKTQIDRVEIKISYDGGIYKIEGKNGDRVINRHSKPIRGVDHTGVYKNNFNRHIVNKRRHDIFYDLRVLEARENFKFDVDCIEDIDTTLYKVMLEFDNFYGTDFTNKYLKIMTHRIERYQGERKSDYKARCKDERKRELENAGIAVEYNLSLTGEHMKGMKLADKIKGIRIAKKHAKVMGADVRYKTVNDELKREVANNPNTDEQKVKRLVIKPEEPAKEPDYTEMEEYPVVEEYDDIYDPEIRALLKRADKALYGQRKASSDLEKKVEKIIEEVEEPKSVSIETEAPKQSSVEIEATKQRSAETETTEQSSVETEKTEPVNPVIIETKKRKEIDRKQKIKNAKREQRESQKWKNVYANNQESIKEKREENKKIEQERKDQKAKSQKAMQQYAVEEAQKKQREQEALEAKRKQEEQEETKRRQEEEQKIREYFAKKRQEQQLAEEEQRKKVLEQGKRLGDYFAKIEAQKIEEEEQRKLANNVKSYFEKKEQEEAELSKMVEDISTKIMNGEIGEKIGTNLKSKKKATKNKKTNENPKKVIRLTRNRKTDKNSKPIREIKPRENKFNSKKRFIRTATSVAAIMLLFTIIGGKIQAPSTENTEGNNSLNRPGYSMKADRDNGNGIKPGDTGEQQGPNIIIDNSIEDQGPSKSGDIIGEQDQNTTDDIAEEQDTSKIGDTEAVEKQDPNEIDDNGAEQNQGEIDDNSKQPDEHEIGDKEEDILSQIRVGAKVNFGDVRFYSSPDGTGTSGSLKNYQDAEIRISIIDISAEKLIVVKDSEMSVRDIRDKYPNAKLSYCVYAVRDGVRYDLGWITADSIREAQQNQNEEGER